MSNWARFQSKLGKKSAAPKPAPPKSAVPPAEPSKTETTTPLLPIGPPSLLDERRKNNSDVPIRVAPSSSFNTIIASSPALEAARLRAIWRLGERFRETCSALGSKRYFSHFETWLWAARAGAGLDGSCVPVIPAPGGVVARAELSRKLTSAGATEADARAACDALDACCVTLADELRALERRPKPPTAVTLRRGSAETDASPNNKKARKRKRENAAQEAPDGSGAADSEQPPAVVRLGFEDVEVVVTEAHFDKLRTLFKAARKKDSKEEEDDERSFRSAAFCCLARLFSLQGGHEHAGGMQGACPQGVFDVLRAEFGVTCELFASPLNCRYPRFCSASIDVDAAFGSYGSFFAFKPLSGAFLANPPFDPELVSAMSKRIDSLMDAANAANEILHIIVVIPTWPDKECWVAVKDSVHCQKVLTLPKSKHAYIDGGQHQGRRAKPLRLSNHDSSLFLLQSKKAASLTPLNFARERKLREAFTAGLKILGRLDKA